MTDEKSKMAFVDGFSEQPRADPSSVRREAYTIEKPSLRQKNAKLQMQN